MIRIPFFDGRSRDQAGRPFPVVAAMRIPQHEPLDAVPAGLSEEERSRGHAMQNPLRRAQYFAGRQLLRRMLEEQFGTEAADWRVFVDGNNPPCLIPATGRAPPLFSVSHSGHDVLCGYICGGVLGVDVQHYKLLRCPWSDVAPEVLHPEEQLRLEHGPEESRWPRFFRSWALKEATGKALGLGLALPFNQIAFTEHGVLEKAPAGLGLMDAGWKFALLDIFPGAASAVAWREA